MCVFMSINLLLFFNLVIAILTSVFAYYQDKQLGLYYEVIVGLFPSMQYDNQWGAIVCA